jgi:2-isopropylmalate synthase
MADIERCAEAIRKAKRGRIHTFLSTSPVHMKWKLQMEPADVLDDGDQVGQPRTQPGGRCGMVGRGRTRTERDFLRRCVEAAIKAGATTINIPDTVGYTYPDEYAAIFRDLIENVPGADGRDLLHPLPQRPGPGRRQQPGGRAGRGAADRGAP